MHSATKGLVPRILSIDESLAVGEIGNTCVAIWRGEVSEAHIRRLAEGLRAVVERHLGVGFLVVVEPSASTPEGSQRQQLVAATASHGSKVKCIANVIEANGFRAAAVRSIISNLALLDRRADAPPRVAFKDVPAAAQWMSEHIPFDPSEFVACVEQLRAQLAAAL
jgi:hypothetical protein